jgi:4-amino-4-deoxy-L-arabinose transferase-like glycosyltransferase
VTPLTDSPRTTVVTDRIRRISPSRVLQMGLAAALILRVAGIGRAWLPGAGILFALLVLVHAIDLAWRRPPAGGWRALVRTHRFAIGLTLAMATAILVRWPSLGSDLGHVPLDIDEGRLATSVRHFFLKGEILHQTVEHYPGLVFWMMTASSLLAYLRALMGGAIHSVFEAPVDLFVLSARMANVFMAAGTVVFTGLIGRTLSGSAAGLVAAFVVAIVPLSVQTTTVVRNDAGQVLFVTAAVWAALIQSRSDGRAWAAIAGALAGIAAAIKYSSLFALAPALIAAAIRGTTATRLERVAITLAGFVVAVATTNHFLWSDFPNLVHQLSAQVAITGVGHWAATENPAAFYTMVLGRFGPGWPLLILAAGFGVYGLSTRRAAMWIFWAFPLLYISFMTGRPSQFPRWVYPLVPFVAVAGASGLVVITRFLRARAVAQPARSRRLLLTALSAALVAIVLVPPAWRGAIAFSHRLTTPTHALVEAWLKENTSPADVVLLEIHWLKLDDSTLRIKRVEELPVVLQGGIYRLFAHNWVVVPEPYFGNPALRRLSFVRRFHADQSAWGGNMGYDFEVYAAPKAPPSIAGADVALDTAEAAPFLGEEWRPDDSGNPGLRLPPGGASLFLPAVARPIIDVELELTGSTAPATPISLAVGGVPVVLSEKPSREPGRRVVAGAVPIDPSARGTELRLERGDRKDEIRIVRLRVG